MKTSRPITKYATIIFVALIVLIPGIGVLVSYYAEKNIREQIQSSNGSVSVINVSLLRRSVVLTDLAWATLPDSANSSQFTLSVQRLSLSGINVYEAIFNKAVQVHELMLDSGEIVYNRNVKSKKAEKPQTNFPDVFFGNVSFRNFEIKIKSDTIPDFSATLNSSVDKITIKPDANDSLQYSISAADVDLANINITPPGSYTVTIASIHLNSTEQKITIDSALLIPRYGKYEFAHVKGEQVGRVNISVPQLIVHGFRFDEMADSVLSCSLIEINAFDLYAFKDRRVPFLRDWNVPLPMAGFTKFAFKTKVDSIHIKDSRVTIEEFPEKGVDSGIITFENINATLNGLNNRIPMDGPSYASLKATGFLMGSGQINAVFQLPLKATQSYNAKGSIRNMDLAKLNSVVEKMAGVRFESGYLNTLLFNFDYNDLASKGSLELDYDDLRVTAINKEKKSTNEFKTLVLNAVMKNNKKRTSVGAIDVARDRKRYIFNVWWISILDGLKSTVLQPKKK